VTQQPTQQDLYQCIHCRSTTSIILRQVGWQRVGGGEVGSWCLYFSRNWELAKQIRGSARPSWPSPVLGSTLCQPIDRDGQDKIIPRGRCVDATKSIRSHDEWSSYNGCSTGAQEAQVNMNAALYAHCTAPASQTTFINTSSTNERTSLSLTEKSRVDDWDAGQF